MKIPEIKNLVRPFLAIFTQVSMVVFFYHAQAQKLFSMLHKNQIRSSAQVSSTFSARAPMKYRTDSSVIRTLLKEISKYEQFLTKQDERERCIFALLPTILVSASFS
jgi:hypothetical protein